MSSQEFKEKFLIERLNKLGSFDFEHLKDNDRFMYRLILDLFKKLLPLTKNAAEHILTNLPGLTEYLIDINAIHKVCVEEDLYHQVVFLISQREFKHTDSFLAVLKNLKETGKTYFPEALKRHEEYFLNTEKTLRSPY